MTRPAPILWFVALLLVGFIARVVNVGWWYVVDPSTLVREAAEPIGLIAVVAGVLLPLVLGWFVAHRRSRVAKWFFVVWAILLGIRLGILLYVQGWIIGMVTAIGGIAVIANLVAAGLLFTSQAKRWLTHGRSADEIAEDFA